MPGAATGFLVGDPNGFSISSTFWGDYSPQSPEGKKTPFNLWEGFFVKKRESFFIHRLILKDSLPKRSILLHQGRKKLKRIPFSPK